MTRVMLDVKHISEMNKMHIVHDSAPKFRRIKNEEVDPATGKPLPMEPPRDPKTGLRPKPYHAGVRPGSLQGQPTSEKNPLTPTKERLPEAPARDPKTGLRPPPGKDPATGFPGLG